MKKDIFRVFYVGLGILVIFFMAMIIGSSCSFIKKVQKLKAEIALNKPTQSRFKLVEKTTINGIENGLYLKDKDLEGDIIIDTITSNKYLLVPNYGIVKIE